MIVRRPAEERGRGNHGWLDSRHTFSFADYHDPRHMGFRALRVINEDRVQAGQGFGTHPHRDMEIISYVLEGELGHQDSMGTGSVIRPGDVQRMSAGTGVRHSEMNTFADQPGALPPDMADARAPGHSASGTSRSASSPKRNRAGCGWSRRAMGAQGSVSVNQDVDLYAGLFKAGEGTRLDLRPGRHAWIQVASGEVTVNGETLHQGDGAAVSDESTLNITCHGGR